MNAFECREVGFPSVVKTSVFPRSQDFARHRGGSRCENQLHITLPSWRPLPSEGGDG